MYRLCNSLPQDPKLGRVIKSQFTKLLTCCLNWIFTTSQATTGSIPSMEALTVVEPHKTKPQRHHRLGRRRLIISDLIINVYHVYTDELQ